MKLTLTLLVVLTAMSMVAQDTGAAATVWGPTPQTPWPVSGRDVSHRHFVDRIPATPAMVGDYELAWVYDWFDNQAAEFIIADMDGNGNQEIILVHDGDSYLAAIEAFEGPLWVFSDPTDSSWTYSVPAVGDVDADGRLEVVYGRKSGKIYQVDDKGDLDWQQEVLDVAESRPLMVDFDGDGRYSTIVPTIRSGTTTERQDLQPESTLFAFSPGGEITGTTGVPKGRAVDAFSIWRPHAEGDLHVLVAPFQVIHEDDDGCRIDCLPSPLETYLFDFAAPLALSLPIERPVSGEVAPLFQTARSSAFTGRVPNGPMFFDLDQDGLDEIILAMSPKQGYPGYAASDNGQVLVLNHHLEVIAKYVPQTPFFLGAASADMVHEGPHELLLGTYAGLEVLTWKDGGFELVAELPIGTVVGLAAADLDADDKPEVAATVSYYDDDNRTGSVILIDDDLSHRELIEAAGPHRGRDSFTHLAIADMDSDGSLEIIAYSYNGLLYVFSGTHGGGKGLETAALAARAEPGYMKEHERMLLEDQDDAPADGASGHIGAGLIALLAAFRICSKPRRT